MPSCAPESSFLNLRERFSCSALFCNWLPNLVADGPQGATMTETELIHEFQKNRLHVILAQLAPTGLLAFAALTTPAIAESSSYVVHAFALILLASGILGALAEYSAASQAQAVIDDLKTLPGSSVLRSRVISFRPWLEVVKFVTPAIFVAIFAFILMALYL